jgi:hypothetical protein
MQNTPATPPIPDRRSAKIRILLPIVFSVAGLVVFLALFWTDARPHKKGHSRKANTASGSERSPVGGQDSELEDLGNSRVNKGNGGSPVGGGPAEGSGKDEGGWWYSEKGKARGDGEDGWWAPEKGK